MKVNKKIFRIETRCSELGMPFYQTILLIEMIYRKLEHPEEEIDKLIAHATQSPVPKQYKKRGKSCMRVSVFTERERLEQELHNCCDHLPEELLRGDIVVNVVEYLYAEEYELLDK